MTLTPQLLFVRKAYTAISWRQYGLRLWPEAYRKAEGLGRPPPPPPRHVHMANTVSASLNRTVTSAISIEASASYPHQTKVIVGGVVFGGQCHLNQSSARATADRSQTVLLVALLCGLFYVGHVRERLQPSTSRSGAARRDIGLWARFQDRIRPTAQTFPIPLHTVSPRATPSPFSSPVTPRPPRALTDPPPRYEYPPPPYEASISENGSPLSSPIDTMAPASRGRPS